MRVCTYIQPRIANCATNQAACSCCKCKRQNAKSQNAYALSAKSAPCTRITSSRYCLGMALCARIPTGNISEFNVHVDQIFAAEKSAASCHLWVSWRLVWSASYVLVGSAGYWLGQLAIGWTNWRLEIGNYCQLAFNAIQDGCVKNSCRIADFSCLPRANPHICTSA